MNEDKILEKIGELLTSHTELLRKEIRGSAEQIKADLKQEITKSQEDTIQVLTDVINEGYNSHEERIQTIEKQLHINSQQ